MAFFPSLPDDAGFTQVLGLNRKAGLALISCYNAMVSARSRLTLAEKEIVAAYASALNAELRGIQGAANAPGFTPDPALIESLLVDFDHAPVATALRPLLAYVRKLTLTPRQMVPGDASAVFAQGWTERDLHDTVLITAIFVCINCLQDGHGVAAVPAIHDHLQTSFTPGDCPMPLRWLE